MKIRKYILFIGIAIGWGIFFWQLVSGMRSIIQTHVGLISPISLIAAFSGMAIYICTQIYNWQVFLSDSGIKLSWFDVARGYTFSSISRYIPGTVWGYISRSEWMYREYGVPHHDSGSASISEVVISTTSAFFVMGLIGLFDVKIDKGIWIIGALSIPLLVWICIINLSTIKRIKLFSIQFPNLVKRISMKTWCIGHLVCIVQWLIYGSISWLLVGSVIGFQSLFQEIWIGLMNATFAFALSWTIGFLIPVIPGGMGIREFVLALMIQNLFELRFDQSSMIAIILRIMYFIAELAWAVWGINQPNRRNARLIE